MEDRFKDVESAFRGMKERFRDGGISQREFYDGLKKLRIKDAEGRFWMIGAKTGRWYYFDGKDWVQSQPPSQNERKAICIHCGFENDLEASACARCGGRVGQEPEDVFCQECGSRLEDPGSPCPFCSGGEKEPLPSGPAWEKHEQDVLPTAGIWDEVTVHSFRPASFFWLGGGLGMVAGILLGLFAGVMGLFPAIVANLPSFFREVQGRLMGGLVFAVSGGLLGFLMLSLAGFLSAVVVNGVLSFMGGLKLRVARPPAKKG